MPDAKMRADLWRKMLPESWLGNDAEDIIKTLSKRELSGGSITNVIRKCAIHLWSNGKKQLAKDVIETILEETT